MPWLDRDVFWAKLNRREVKRWVENVGMSDDNGHPMIRVCILYEDATGFQTYETVDLRQ